jgi:hypothetical protein
MLGLVSFERNITMRVECRCGSLIKDYGETYPNFAQFVTSEDCDGCLDAIEKAIKNHPKEVADQWVICGTGPFFRSMCQCLSCGRLHIEDARGTIREFIPADSATAKDIFKGRSSQRKLTD